MDMIDRQRPQPWTHAEALEMINQGLLIIGVEVCALLVGYRGGIRVCVPMLEQVNRD